MGAENKKKTKKQFMGAGFINFGQVIVGHSIGWIAPVHTRLGNAEETPLDRAITDTESTWMLIITFIGIIGGPLISGYLSNVVGRKPCLYFGGSMLFVSYILMAVGKSLVMMYIARFLVGVGIGVLFVTNLVFIAELTSAKIRSTLLTLTGLSTTQGILSVYSIGSTFSFSIINGMVAFLCAEYIAFIFFFVPESPVYHVMKGNVEQATATLKALGRQAEVEEVVTKAKDKPKPKITQLTELYTDKSNRKAVFLITILNILTQFNGVIVVIAFVSYVIKMTESDIDAYLSSTTIGVTQFLVSIIVPLFVYKLGRKILLLVSCAICSLSLDASQERLSRIRTGGGSPAPPVQPDTEWFRSVMPLSMDGLASVVDDDFIEIQPTATFLNDSQSQKVIILNESIEMSNVQADEHKENNNTTENFFLGTYFYLCNNNYPITENSKWLLIVLLMVFCVAYYSGMGFIPNTFVGEVFTDTCRSFGVTFTVTISWLFGFGVSAVFGYVLSAWGASVIFWMFSGICAFAFSFTLVFVPEIKGKSLSEIRELLCK